MILYSALLSFLTDLSLCCAIKLALILDKFFAFTFVTTLNVACKWQYFVNTVMNIQVALKAEKFLTRLISVSFLTRTQLHGI